MSYVNRGLGGAESCGQNQQWDPNYKFGNITGQCTPKGTPMTPTPEPGLFDKFMGTMFPAPVAPAPQPGMTPAQVQAMIAAQKSGGMSQNTMIALGLGAVGLLAVVMIASRK